MRIKKEAGPYYTKRVALAAKKYFRKKFNVKIRMKYHMSNKYDTQAPCYRLYWQIKEENS